MAASTDDGANAATPAAPQEQSTVELVRSIALDTGTLVRKEMELARQELLGAVSAKLAAAASAAVAGIFGLFALGFVGLALAAVLDEAGLAPWLSRLIVAIIFGIAGFVAVRLGSRRAAGASLKPEETARTLKEDVEWAKDQTRR